MIYTKFLEKELKYDGSQLSSHFTYKITGTPGDSIISFSGPCEIPEENMADLEDVIGGDSIYSDRMLHFIGEFFGKTLEEVILIQRIFASIVREQIFLKTGKFMRRDGDDLFERDRKLSISIATSTGISTMFHFALNLDSRNTPVDTVSLPELGWEDYEEFAWIILEKISSELESCRRARCKVRMK